MAAEPLTDAIQLIKRIACEDLQALADLSACDQCTLVVCVFQPTPGCDQAEAFRQGTLVWPSAQSFEGPGRRRASGRHCQSRAPDCSCALAVSVLGAGRAVALVTDIARRR
jgi:hypothetical protein